jgi:RHS repeat-associated protein
MRKHLYLPFVLLFNFITVSAQQFSNENFIYSESPLLPVTENTYSTLSSNDIVKNISYFDGLGRLKQTIGIGQGTSNNLLYWREEWNLGSGSTPLFSQNGSTSENLRIDGVNPFGKTDRLWRCVNDAASDPDGGWNTSSAAVDKTKPYLYAVWVKRTGGQDGTTYHGTNNVEHLNGTANENPYFWYGDLPLLNTWYLMVGLIHPAGYTGGDSAISGVYDQTGAKVLSGIDFRWKSTTTTSYFRSYLYYATDVNVSQYFYAPSLQRIETGQPSVTALIRGIEANDIVTPYRYDAYGREEHSYLPYAANTAGMLQNNALVDVLQHYNTPKYENTSNPFSQKQFEASPLNRVIKQAAPGEDWKLNSGHEIKSNYQTNTASEVRLFTVSLTLNDKTYTPALALATLNSGFYSAGELYKQITYDENWTSGKNNSTEEFKDKEGRVVLKKTYSSYYDINGNLEAAEVPHETYYIYDDYGNLTYVLPPKLNPTTAPIATINAQLGLLGYQYKYDTRNRLVEKNLPAKQWEFIVYDKLDRPVATGPALSPFTNLNGQGWVITKYDAFSRPVYTGWTSATPATAAGRITLQNAQDAASVLNETRQANNMVNNAPVSYSNTVSPLVFELLTVNYYDDYNFSYPVVSVPSSIEGQAVLASTQVKGLPTCTLTRVLNNSTTLDTEITIPFYDQKARPVRIQHTNHLGGYTHTDSKLDFAGKTLYSISRHKRSSVDTELVTKDEFKYSDQQRLTMQTHQINSNPVELIASASYDALGQQISKDIGNTKSKPLQKIDYTYNIRGWLTNINNTAALQIGTDPKDLFAFKINYNNPTAVSGVARLYNGNIAETSWKTDSDSTPLERGYGYKYDHLNRLTASIFQLNGTVNNTYNENLTYDKNGNILKLIRNGNNSATANQIDNLTYTYLNEGNQLAKVMDSRPNTTGLQEEFKDNGSASDDYSYDAYGNMITDSNKGITSITYNHLNLPTKIAFGAGNNISYIYNATGQKVQKLVVQGANTSTTDYQGGYQYNNAVLKFFPTAEGFVEYEGSSYKYVYQYKDHLGNVRLSYKNTGTAAAPTLQIDEENNYYPFGLKHKGYNIATPSTNEGLKYKYNGKELQDELGLNVTAMDYRQYDSAIGRFNSIDVFSELSHSITPYRFAYNNPVFFSDPTGLYEVDGNGNITITDKKEIAMFTDYLKNNQKASVNEMSEHIFDANNGFAYELQEVVLQSGSKKSENDFHDNVLKQIGESQKKIESFDGTIYSNNQEYDDEGIPNSVHAGAVGLASTVGDAVMKARFSETFKAMQTTNLTTSFTKTLKTTGKVFQVAGAAASLYTYYQSDGSGADKARLAGAAIITGTAFIPVVGPFLSVGLGVLDGVGAFDGLYQKFD